MFGMKRFVVGVSALAGLLASPGASAVPFQMLVEDDPHVDEIAGVGSVTFVELVTVTHGQVLVGDRHLAPYGLGAAAILGGPFDSGFALSVPVASPPMPHGSHSFVSGVIAARTPLASAQALPPSARAAPPPSPAAEGAGMFAEPASVALLGLGLAGLAYSMRRRHRTRRHARR